MDEFVFKTFNIVKKNTFYFHTAFYAKFHTKLYEISLKELSGSLGF